MKILNLVKHNIMKLGTMFTLFFFSLSAFADDSTWSNLNSFYSGVVLAQGSVIFKITIAIATIAGIILIVKGLVHLKQNYTGTGQEKHLSKGIASLGFGTALILAIPLSHALVGAAGTGTNFNTGADSSVDFGGT